MITFDCDTCGRLFGIPAEHYDGRWDHAGHPECPECEEKREEAAA